MFSYMRYYIVFKNTNQAWEHLLIFTRQSPPPPQYGNLRKKIIRRPLVTPLFGSIYNEIVIHVLP